MCSTMAAGLNGSSSEVTALLMDTRTLRPFKSSEEYLYAMREDLAEWLCALYPQLQISVDCFMDRLEDGVALCKHANNVRKAASEHAQRKLERSISKGSNAIEMRWPILSPKDVQHRSNVKPGTFLARDNVSNFITWCKRDLEILECLLFETDDLILRKNEKHVVLCLMEVARRGSKFGMPAPMLVQFEREIDREIAMDQKRERAGSTGDGSGGDGLNGALNSGDSGAGMDEEEEEEEEEDYPIQQQFGPVPQIVTNDLKSLDEMVRDLVERCTCPTQFPMIRVSEGKYRIGDTKVLIFVRILRKHVMVRVGGGWDTLSHYLDKHDPCRCRASHRTLLSGRLVTKSGNNVDLNTAQVHYDRVGTSPPRTRRSSTSSQGSNSEGRQQNSVPASPARARPRSRSPRPASSNRPRSRSPRPPQQTNNSDSGSEVSDEGYRSLGHKLTVPNHDVDDLPTERPESAISQRSDCSDEHLAPPRMRTSTRRSASPCVRKATPSNAKTTPLPRSRSVSGDPSKMNVTPASPLSRTAVGYRSARSPRTAQPPPQGNTWNGPRGPKSRPSLGADTFSSPFGPASTRRSLPRDTRRSQAPSPAPSAPGSPNKQVLLQQIIDSSEQDEAAFIQNLRDIISQYEHKVEASPTPRKMSGDTKIPVPTFYKQGAKPANNPDDVCCL